MITLYQRYPGHDCCMKHTSNLDSPVATGSEQMSVSKGDFVIPEDIFCDDGRVRELCMSIYVDNVRLVSKIHLDHIIP